jgi:hypothetical protein
MNNENLESVAKTVLLKYLTKGEVETHTEIMKDSKGRVISIKQKIVNKPCPQWVINKVLGDFEEIQALTVLVEAGWLPEEIISSVSDRFDIFKHEVKQIIETKETL